MDKRKSLMVTTKFLLNGKNNSTSPSSYYCRICGTQDITENSIKDHESGQRHKWFIDHKDEIKRKELNKASKTSSADVLVTKSNAAICYEVGTASATRTDTIARSIQFTDDCDGICESVFETINMFDNVINSPIEICNEMGLSMMVKWWTWHGLNFADDFHVSGDIRCELCDYDFPFGDMYKHAEYGVKHINLLETFSVSDGGMRLQGTRAFCFVCNTYENSFEDHQFSPLHIINRTRAIVAASGASEANGLTEREMLSYNSMFLIKPFLQTHWGRQRAEYETFYEELKCEETVQTNTKISEVAELSKMNYHGLELQLIQFQRVVRCLLCKEDVMPKHASSHVSSRKHLDRVEIPFTHEDHCIRTLQYLNNMVAYHCAHCNVILTSISELNQHLKCKTHLDHLDSAILQEYCGCRQMKSRAAIREMKELAVKNEDGD